MLIVTPCYDVGAANEPAQRRIIPCCLPCSSAWLRFRQTRRTTSRHSTSISAPAFARAASSFATPVSSIALVCPARGTSSTPKRLNSAWIAPNAAKLAQLCAHARVPWQVLCSNAAPPAVSAVPSRAKRGQTINACPNARRLAENAPKPAATWPAWSARAETQVSDTAKRVALLGDPLSVKQLASRTASSQPSGAELQADATN